MKGWEFTTTHEPLRLVSRPEPIATPGEVVIDVRAAGLCHSDVGALDDPDWLDMITTRPVILGHEIAGVVCEVGEGVDDFQRGDRVGVCPSSGTRPGYIRDGGYAQKTSARAKDLVLIPEGLDFAAAAAGTDAGMTAYHAVMVTGRVGAGSRVGIIGLGGLGQVGARLAVLAGAEVYAADISPGARDLAPGIGVLEVAESIEAFADKDLNVIVDFAGFGATTASALAAIGRRGRVVLVGMGALEATISTSHLISKRAELAGSMGGTVSDIAAVYELMARGALAPLITEISFEEIPAGLDLLRQGKSAGRLVAVMEA